MEFCNLAPRTSTDRVRLGNGSGIALVGGFKYD